LEVDEEVCDDELTFIGCDGPLDMIDLYHFEDISLPTGSTINSIVVTAKSLSMYKVANTYKYKLLISPDGIDIYESPNLQVVNGGDDYSFWYEPWCSANWAWSSKPEDGQDLTEEYINDMQIGVKSSSPTVFTLNLYNCFANAAGDLTQLTPSAAPNWDCINDEIDCIGATTYVGSTTLSTWKYDLYNVYNHSEPGYCAIAYVEIDVRARSNWNGLAPDSKAKTCLKTHGTTYYGSETIIGNQDYWQVDVTTRYDTNPFTGAAWTWAEIADLQSGVGLYVGPNSTWARACYVGCHVYAYTPSQPWITTSQLYATVNYDLNEDVVCNLPKPEMVSVNHDVDSNALEFWSGNREVYATGRNSKKLQISGSMWDGCTDGILTCEEIINCIRAMGRRQTPITLSGMRYTNMNTEFNIISFSWKRITEKPNSYDWELVLEFKLGATEGGLGFTYTLPMELS
jgi:hypothetical protein